MQAPDEPKAPRREPVSMPTPEQLGVALAHAGAPAAPAAPAGQAAGTVDWTATVQQLGQLGVASWHVESLPGGACRLTCWLPRPQPGVQHRIDAEGATQAEAVRLCLDKVRQCRPARP
jgi:hypothetical protein